VPVTRLRRVLLPIGLKAYVAGENQSLELVALDRPHEHFTLGKQDVEKAERLQVRTPEPQAFIISGRLNAIEHSRKKFQLVLDDGKIIPGRIDEDFLTAEEMRTLWGKKVSVRGQVYFKPSGSIRLIDAHLLKPMELGEEVFSMAPCIQTEAAFVRDYAQPDSTQNWPKEIWNQWPGDESIEELLAEL
jgi:hypothetical protein